jgi:hypothetical protein
VVYSTTATSQDRYLVYCKWTRDRLWWLTGLWDWTYQRQSSELEVRVSDYWCFVHNLGYGSSCCPGLCRELRSMRSTDMHRNRAFLLPSRLTCHSKATDTETKTLGCRTTSREPNWSGKQTLEEISSPRSLPRPQALSFFRTWSRVSPHSYCLGSRY